MWLVLGRVPNLNKFGTIMFGFGCDILHLIFAEAQNRSVKVTKVPIQKAFKVCIVRRREPRGTQDLY